MARPRTAEISLSEGGAEPTPAESSLRSSAAVKRPVAVSTANTSWPRSRKAGTICAALAMETSRSSLVPPNNTATFTASSLYSEGKWRLNTRRALAHYAWPKQTQASVGASVLRRSNFDDRRRQLRRRPGKPLFQIDILRLARSQVEAPAVVADYDVTVIR